MEWHRGCWTAVQKHVLIILLSQLLAVMIYPGFTGAEQPQLQAGATVCSLRIRGSLQGDAIASSSLSCFGPNPLIATMNETMLGSRVKSANNVAWAAASSSRCAPNGSSGMAATSCLLTLCSGTNTVLVNSSVIGVVAKGSVGIICLVGSASLTVQDSSFLNNTAINGTLHVRDSAQLVLQRSLVLGAKAYAELNPVIDGNGGALYLQDNGRAVVIDSTIQGL